MLVHFLGPFVLPSWDNLYSLAGRKTTIGEWGARLVLRPRLAVVCISHFRCKGFRWERERLSLAQTPQHPLRKQVSRRLLEMELKLIFPLQYSTRLGGGALLPCWLHIVCIEKNRNHEWDVWGWEYCYITVAIVSWAGLGWVVGIKYWE